jgi:hypothetical protein
MAISFSLIGVVLFVIMTSSNRSFTFAFSHHPSPTHHHIFSDCLLIRSDLPPCRSWSLTRMQMAGDLSTDEGAGKIRYLGSGDDAIIRPGVVLVSPAHEYDHFLMRSAVFIYAIGLDEKKNTIVRGVVLDHPTAFTIGEMSPNVMGALSNNRLFRGGYDGSDTAMLLHSAGGPDGPIKSGSMIGSSGIFEGGVVSAMESADAGVVETNRCKFFFNFMQFTEKELDNMFLGIEDGDAWVSVEIPVDYVLSSDYDRGQLWSKLRNSIREIRIRSKL